MVKKEIKPGTMTVAGYLQAQIDICGKSQIAIAEECGFPRANFISMLKLGKSKVPIAKIYLLAKSIGVDPSFLFRKVMGEYYPDLLTVTEECMGRMVSENEYAIIEEIRKVNPSDPKMNSGAVTKLRSWAGSL